MTPRAAIMFYRTAAGSDELASPKLGLSLPQRKMLRSCTQKIHLLELEQLFSGETSHYARERFVQDLDRMVELGLLYSNGAPLAPAAIKARPIKLPARSDVVYADAGVKAAPARRPKAHSALRPKVIGGFFAGVMVAAGGMIWANRAEPPRPGQHAANDQQIFTENEGSDSNLQAWANYIRQIDEPRPRVKAGKIETAGDHEKLAKAEKERKEHKEAKAKELKPAYAADSHVPPVTAVTAPTPLRSSQTLAANDSISETPAARTSSSVAPPAAGVAPVAPPLASSATPAFAPAPAPVAAPIATPVVVASIAPTPLPAPQRPGDDSSNEKKPLKLLHREAADFPPEASLTDVHRGKVKAKLTLDEKGNVADIQIVESKPNRLFVRPAIWSLKKWRYEGTGKTETAMVDLDFRE